MYEEEFAKQNGFEYISTETMSFQAKPFYVKRAYLVYNELVDSLKGHTTFCMVKKL